MENNIWRKQTQRPQRGEGYNIPRHRPSSSTLCPRSCYRYELADNALRIHRRRRLLRPRQGSDGCGNCYPPGRHRAKTGSGSGSPSPSPFLSDHTPSFSLHRTDRLRTSRVCVHNHDIASPLPSPRLMCWSDGTSRRRRLPRCDQSSVRWQKSTGSGRGNMTVLVGGRCCSSDGGRWWETRGVADCQRELQTLAGEVRSVSASSVEHRIRGHLSRSQIVPAGLLS